jgi:hypothetical protein
MTPRQYFAGMAMLGFMLRKFSTEHTQHEVYADPSDPHEEPTMAKTSRPTYEYDLDFDTPDNMASDLCCHAFMLADCMLSQETEK